MPLITPRGIRAHFHSQECVQLNVQCQEVCQAVTGRARIRTIPPEIVAVQRFTDAGSENQTILIGGTRIASPHDRSGPAALAAGHIPSCQIPGVHSSMKKNEAVTKIMTTDPVTISRNEPVSSARKVLEQNGIHHLPVTDGKQLVGILSSSDFLRVSFGEFGNQDDRSLDAVLDHTYTIPDLMNANPTTIESTQTVRDAAGILVASGFHSLPVVKNGQLVGIVTSTDLIQYLLDQY